MKKLSIYALTAVTALAVTGIPVTAYAASDTYGTIKGNQKMIVVGGNDVNGLKDFFGQAGETLRLSDCDMILPGFSQNLTPAQPDEDGSMDTYSLQVVKLVNEERMKAGLSPLTVDAMVVNAAEIRAKELETSFSHTRPNGSDFSAALTSAGVQYKRAGENIAYGQKSPDQVMLGWMNSAGHRANILNGNFTSIGIGHYRNAAGVDYWTQLFVQ